MEPLKSVIVLPTYNEAHNIKKLVAWIFENYPQVHIIIVDDNSPDGTGEVADHLAEQYPSLQVIHRPDKAGLGSAYIAGFKKALSQGAELIFEMDADFSHDPKYIQDFFKAVETADVVIGSRYIGGVRVDGWRFRRLLLSKAANMFVSYIMVKPVWDFTAGFRCYRRKVLDSIVLDEIKSDGYAFQIEMTYLAFKHGFKVKEIPILFRERMSGHSKISRNIVWEAVWLTWKCRAPLHEIIKHLSFLFRDYTKFVMQNNNDQV
jgi:dolichol-phosphate mannosyltransferase